MQNERHLNGIEFHDTDLIKVLVPRRCWLSGDFLPRFYRNQNTEREGKSSETFDRLRSGNDALKVKVVMFVALENHRRPRNFPSTSGFVFIFMRLGFSNSLERV